MVAGGDAAKVGEGFDDSHGAVKAAVEVRGVIEENDTCDAGVIFWFAKEGTDDGFETTRFKNEGGAEPVGFFG